MSGFVHPALESTGRMRRFAEGVETAGDREWLERRIAIYLAGAADGLRMEDAFDLSVPRGGEPWWKIEARDRRDRTLRALARRFYAGQSVAGQAAAIAVLIRRYESTAWLRDRHACEMPGHYAGTPKALLFHAFHAGVPVPSGLRQLRTILGAGAS